MTNVNCLISMLSRTIPTSVLTSGDIDELVNGAYYRVDQAALVSLLSLVREDDVRRLTVERFISLVLEEGRQLRKDANDWLRYDDWHRRGHERY